MKFGVLGTGMVGKRIASKLIQLGNEVMMGSRTAGNADASDWADKNGSKASHGTFGDAAKFGEILFLCVKGDAAVDALKLARHENLPGKIIIDLTNPLDFSGGMPPSLFISNTSSLGEEIQKAVPEARVVKTLNLVSNEIMGDPGKTGGEPTMFLCGNDSAAREEVKKILGQFGWKDILDLGDITGARGMEMLLPIWLRIWGIRNDGIFAFKIVGQKK